MSGLPQETLRKDARRTNLEKNESKINLCWLIMAEKIKYAPYIQFIRWSLKTPWCEIIWPKISIIAVPMLILHLGVSGATKSRATKIWKLIRDNFHPVFRLGTFKGRNRSTRISFTFLNSPKLSKTGSTSNYCPCILVSLIRFLQLRG